MNIRLLTVTDFEATYALWNAAGLWVRSEENERERFITTIERNPDTSFALVDDADQVLGVIIGAWNGRTASIVRMSIHPDIQKQGHGSALIAHLEDALRAKGVKKIEAHVHEGNKAVVSFYEKLDYEHDQIIVLNKKL